MLELALHILDIAENSTRAGARNVRISVDEDTSSDRFRLVIEDDGAGMGPEEAVKALDPFFTTKKVRRVGLGLPMLAQAAETTGGGLKLESEPGKGTRVSVEMGLAHIDRQPLGDIPGALVALIAGNPEINIVYRHARDGSTYRLDTVELKKELEDVPINHIEVLQFIREHVSEGLEQIGSRA